MKIGRLSIPALLAASALAGVLSAPAEAASPKAVNPGWKRFDLAATGEYALRYVPASLDQSQPAPVVVFLHGSGAFPEHWQDLLEPVADAQGCVLLLPKSGSTLGFGIDADDAAIAEALELLRAELAVDEGRVSIAGHSSGGAFALVLAYGTKSRFAAVFSMGAPYRTVLRVEDADYTAPARLYYGNLDPNYTGQSFAALRDQLQRLGVAVESEIAPGYGHSDRPPTTIPDGFAFLLSKTYHTAGGCQPSDTRLCLRDGRFAVEATWRDPSGTIGPARVTEARTADSGLLYFFRPGNWELQVKVLNGCPVNGRYWAFAAGTTNVEYDLTVTDLSTGQQAHYHNPQGTIAVTVTDTGAFASCP